MTTPETIGRLTDQQVRHVTDAARTAHTTRAHRQARAALARVDPACTTHGTEVLVGPLAAAAHHRVCGPTDQTCTLLAAAAFWAAKAHEHAARLPHTHRDTLTGPWQAARATPGGHP